MAFTAKITNKGQVTIPKTIRRLLKSNVVEFKVQRGVVVVKPVGSVGGALAAFSKVGKKAAAPRKTTWERVAHERGKKNHS